MELRVCSLKSGGRQKEAVKMKYEATNCISIQVNHYKEAIAFYKDVMKMEIKKTDTHETEFQTGDLTLFIEDQPNNSVLLEFRVENIEMAKEELINSGCQITHEYRDKSVLIKDPYGMTFHLFQD